MVDSVQRRNDAGLPVDLTTEQYAAVLEYFGITANTTNIAALQEAVTAINAGQSAQDLEITVLQNATGNTTSVSALALVLAPYLGGGTFPFLVEYSELAVGGTVTVTFQEGWSGTPRLETSLTEAGTYTTVPLTWTSNTATLPLEVAGKYVRVAVTGIPYTSPAQQINYKPQIAAVDFVPASVVAGSNSVLQLSITGMVPSSDYQASYTLTKDSTLTGPSGAQTPLISANASGAAVVSHTYTSTAAGSPDVVVSGFEGQADLTASLAVTTATALTGITLTPATVYPSTSVLATLTFSGWVEGQVVSATIALTNCTGLTGAQDLTITDGTVELALDPTAEGAMTIEVTYASHTESASVTVVAEPSGDDVVLSTDTFAGVADATPLYTLTGWSAVTTTDGSSATKDHFVVASEVVHWNGTAPTGDNTAPGTYLIARNVGLDARAMSVKVNPNNESWNASMYLCVAGQDERNHIKVRIGSAFNVIEIMKVQDGVTTTMGTSFTINPVIAAGDTVEVRKIGNKIAVFVRGIRFGAGQDFDTAGLVLGNYWGFSTYSKRGGWDDVTMKSITALVPGTSIPAEVTGLAVVGTPGESTVALSWNAVFGATDYVIQYRTPAGSGSWTTFTDSVSTSVNGTVSGLTAETEYEFQVAAKNDAGTGPYSTTTVTATTAVAGGGDPPPPGQTDTLPDATPIFGGLTTAYGTAAPDIGINGSGPTWLNTTPTTNNMRLTATGYEKIGSGSPNYGGATTGSDGYPTEDFWIRFANHAGSPPAWWTETKKLVVQLRTPSAIQPTVRNLYGVGSTPPLTNITYNATTGVLKGDVTCTPSQSLIVYEFTNTNGGVQKIDLWHAGVNPDAPESFVHSQYQRIFAGNFLTTIRLMDMSGVNGYRAVNWSDRKTPSNWSTNFSQYVSDVQSPFAPMPYENMLKFVEECGFERVWMTEPINYDYTSMTAFAEWMAANVPAGVKTIHETGNEVWNYGPGFVCYEENLGYACEETKAVFAAKPSPVHFGFGSGTTTPYIVSIEGDGTWATITFSGTKDVGTGGFITITGAGAFNCSYEVFDTIDATHKRYRSTATGTATLDTVSGGMDLHYRSAINARSLWLFDAPARFPWSCERNCLISGVGDGTTMTLTFSKPIAGVGTTLSLFNSGGADAKKVTFAQPTSTTLTFPSTFTGTVNNNNVWVSFEPDNILHTAGQVNFTQYTWVRHAWRSREAAIRWKAAYEAAGRGDELFNWLGWQTGASATMAKMLAFIDTLNVADGRGDSAALFKMIGHGMYLNCNNSPIGGGFTNDMLTVQTAEEIVAAMQIGADYLGPRFNLEALALLATAYGMELTCYEMGFDTKETYENLRKTISFDYAEQEINKAHELDEFQTIVRTTYRNFRAWGGTMGCHYQGSTGSTYGGAGGNGSFRYGKTAEEIDPAAPGFKATKYRGIKDVVEGQRYLRAYHQVPMTGQMVLDGRNMVDNFWSGGDYKQLSLLINGMASANGAPFYHTHACYFVEAPEDGDYEFTAYLLLTTTSACTASLQVVGQPTEVASMALPSRGSSNTLYDVVGPMTLALKQGPNFIALGGPTANQAGRIKVYRIAIEKV